MLRFHPSWSLLLALLTLLPCSASAAPVEINLNEEDYRKGILSGQLLCESDDIVCTVGITEFVPGVNDFNTAPPEKKLTLKKVGTVVEFGPEQLFERCTIRFAGERNQKPIFEERRNYDRRAFLDFEVTHVLASLDHQFITADCILGMELKGLSFEISLHDLDGRQAATITEEAAKSKQLKLPLAGVKPGQYAFTARLLDEQGAELQKISDHFTVFPEKPEWLGNQLGMTNGKVPAPWTPLEITADNAVKCWGRRYRFEDKGLPVEIEGSNGVMARHVRFVSNHKKFKTRSFSWTKRGADSVEYEAVLSLNGNQIKLNGIIEFDGLIWLKPTFIPAPGKTFPSVSFEYDAMAEHATLFYCGEHIARRSGLIGPDGWSKTLLNNPGFWVGNDQDGLYFCADDLRGWNVKDLDKAAVHVGPVVSERRTVTVPLLEAEANGLNQTYSMEFAILATPSRPMPKGFRNWQINGGTKETHHFYAKGVTELFNIPFPLDKYGQSNLDYWAKRDILAPVYLAFLYISPFCDEYRWFGRSWSGEIDPNHRFYPVNASEHYLICPNAPGYTDWYIDRLDKMLTETNAPGIYFDYMQPDIYPCKNPAHGCLWEKNGKMHSSNRLKASREWAKRVYILMKQHDPDGMVVFHDSSGFSPAIHAFCDVTWSGEQTTRRMFEKNLSYHDIFEQDKFRVEFRHEPWGVPHVFLPQYLRAVSIWAPDWFSKGKRLPWNELYKAFCDDPVITADTWYLAGYILVHDSDFSGDWGMWERQVDVCQMRQMVGWDDSVQFYGYFNPKNPFGKLSPADTRVMISSFRAARGWIVIVLNDTDLPQKVTFKVPEEIVRSSSSRTTTWPAKSPLELKAAVQSMNLEPCGVQFIVIEN